MSILERLPIVCSSGLVFLLDGQLIYHSMHGFVFVERNVSDKKVK